MKSNYNKIGQYIRLIDERNFDLKVETLLGLTINKDFIPSVANTVGSDMSRYKIIRKNQFACSLMQVRRDKKIPVALQRNYKEAIISQAYPVFDVTNKDELLPEYLMMWFSRSEFDREACFYAVGGVRGSLEWEDFCNMQLPVPDIEKQKAIVKEYNKIVNRIKLNEQLNQKLEEIAQAIYKEWFVDFEFPMTKEYAESIGKPELEGKASKANGGEMVWNEELGNEIPKGWDSCEIIELFELQRGFDLPIQKRVKGDTPIYAANGLTDFHNESKVKGPAIVTGRSGTIGNVFYVSKDCWPLNTTLWIKSFNLATPIYAYFILKNTELKGFHSGSAVPTLNRNDIHALTTIRPYRDLIEKFEEQQNKAFSHVDVIVKEVEKLIFLKDMLLSKMAKA